MDWKHIIFITLICTTWCGETETDDLIPKMENNNSTEMPTTKHLAESINEFGYRLLTAMMKRSKDDNVALSPTALAGLLATILLGSVGKTYDELAKTLGFSQDILANRKNHEHFGELLKSMNVTDNSSKTTYADVLFVDAHTQLRTVYRDYLNRVYNADVLNADFERRFEVKEMINEWVKIHTEGKIESFLKQPLPASTKLVSISALYFRGQWQKPFLPEHTAKMVFKKPSNEVTADLMLNLGEFDYIFSEKDDLHMIALPYNDSTTVMYALKPRFPNRLSLPELMDRLDYPKINDLISQMTTRKSVIRFPKMDIKNDIKLEESLKALGVQSVFIPGEANLALMVDGDTVGNRTENEILSKVRSGDEDGLKETLNRLPNPGVHVDSVIHNVKITISEYGTEAVAAASALLARSAEQFYADSPFYMFIRNERTKLVTFSAVIFDPTK